MPSPPPRPLPQKTIGVLGGMSNQATGEYYRLLNERLNAHLRGWDNGEIVVVSVNFGNIEHFVRNDLWDEAKTYLLEKIERLERAGADVIVCVSNTMHRVVEPVMAERTTPFIHIADPTGEAIRRAGLTRVALLGTMPVMRSAELAQRYWERFGVEVLAPSDPDKTIVDRIIFDELVRRDLRSASKAEYLRIVDELRRAGAQGVILGCTEIFLLIGQDDLPGFPVFDTTALHVDAVANFALGINAGSRPCSS
jgi:aspartate racemase